MQSITIRLSDVHHAQSCPSCGQHHPLPGRGPRLYLDTHAAPLCRGCGKKLAPSMAALLELASTAERIGRRSRQLLTPPMESLLDLARAAENYSDATPCRRAG